jgi:arylsulfatase A-like enzyme
VVLFINESLARFFPSSDGASTGLMAKIVADSSPKAGAWIEFPYAKTNSTVTEISVPSMLTGVDPVEGSAKIHAMPFVFDLAHAAGYRTAFFTSQDYSLAGFDNFYRPARIETYVTENNLPIPLPRVNDTGIDDMEIADRVADYVHHLGADERCFLVINSNALHVPLQTTSKIPLPKTLTRAEQKVAFILESYYGRIFAALEDTGRLTESLMIVTSDHGDRDVKRPRSVDRIGDHFDEVITVPFYVHLPVQLAPQIKERVALNAERTVANVDIAPTLAEIFGYGPPPGLDYAGFSLFSIVPSNRIVHCLTTNEWKQWSQSAFSLSQGTERFIFMANAGAFWFDVARDPQELHGVTQGARYDAFLQHAMTVPLLQDMLLRLEIDRQDQRTTQ